MRLFLSLGIVAAALAFGAPAPSQAQQQEAIDMRLRSAGFKVRLATTAQEIAHLKRVPPRVMLSRTEQGRRYYAYADPDFCKCVFVGDEHALRSFKDMVPPADEQPSAYRSSRPSTTELLIREMDADLGQTDIFGPPF
ncbi:MAG TPA: hypothetical protein VFK79_01315 [Xanthobacteraceae bacterium]|nr:hypothetical protein [Xanthobacteraceae bacterium]